MSNEEPKIGQPATPTPEMQHPLWVNITALLFLYDNVKKAMVDVEAKSEEEKNILHVLDAMKRADFDAGKIVTALMDVLRFVTPGPDIFTGQINIGMLQNPQTGEKAAVLQLPLGNGRNMALPMVRKSAEDFEKNIRLVFDQIFGRIPLITH